MAEESRLVDAAGKFDAVLASAAENTAAIASNLERAITAMTGAAGSFNAGMGGARVNDTSTGRTVTAGGFVAPTFGATGKGYRDASFMDMFGTGLSRGLDAAYGTLAAAAMALPEPNEAIYTDLLQNRLRFYGQNRDLTLAASAYGTPTSPMDAAYAANYGASVGLLPGLSNFYTSGTSGQPYSGIMGGAALASNLSPGLGIQGGMGVMASLNQARRVNMFRMMGVSVRNIGGSQMNDLPAIIKRLYDILVYANGGKNPTPEDMAISLQSGNALDSLLNQYVGDDAELRQVVISGLMQMVQTGGASLYTSGSNFELAKTGGTSRTVASLGMRSTREMELIQAYTPGVTKGIRGANDLLDLIYKGLIAGGENFGFAQGAASVMGFAETFGGARNGAGAILMKTIADLASPFGAGNSVGLSNFFKIGGLASFFGLSSLAGMDQVDFGVNPWPGERYGGTEAPYGRGNLASPTVNVFTSSEDPTGIASKVGNALTYLNQTGGI